jgi:putative phosphoesterase
MIRIALLADIHGNLPALEAVVADLATQRVARVCNLGDHASGPLWPSETVTVLMAQQAWVQIAGNHDRVLVADDPATHGDSDRFAFARLNREQLDWLARCPATANVGEDLLLCHGIPTDDLTPLLETVEHGRFRLARHEEIATRLRGAGSGVIACGHTHFPRAVQQGALLLVNPGSVGLQAFSDVAGEAYVGETGSPHARYAVLERGAGGWSVEFRVVPYDHEAAARQAERNGSPQWAAALRSGYAV